jgi:hypothetical protein
VPGWQELEQPPSGSAQAVKLTFSAKWNLITKVTPLSLHTTLTHELDHIGHTTLTPHHSDSTPCAHSSLLPAAPCSLHPRAKSVAVLCSQAQAGWVVCCPRCHSPCCQS